MTDDLYKIVYNKNFKQDTYDWFMSPDRYDRERQLSKGFIHIIRTNYKKVVIAEKEYYIYSNEKKVYLLEYTPVYDSKVYKILVEFFNTTLEEVADMFNYGYNFVGISHFLRMYEKVKTGKVRLVKDDINSPVLDNTIKDALVKLFGKKIKSCEISPEHNKITVRVDYGIKDIMRKDELLGEMKLGLYEITVEPGRGRLYTSIHRFSGPIDKDFRYISPYVKCDGEGYSTDICYGSAQGAINTASNRLDYYTILHYTIELVDSPEEGAEPYIDWITLWKNMRIPKHTISVPEGKVYCCQCKTLYDDGCTVDKGLYQNPNNTYCNNCFTMNFLAGRQPEEIRLLLKEYNALELSKKKELEKFLNSMKYSFAIKWVTEEQKIIPLPEPMPFGNPYDNVYYIDSLKVDGRPVPMPGRVLIDDVGVIIGQAVEQQRRRELQEQNEVARIIEDEFVREEDEEAQPEDDMPW